MALVTSEDYKLFYNVTDTKQDSQITEAVVYAEALAFNFIGRDMNSTSFTETYDGGSSIIILANFPITAMTSVTVDGTLTTDYTLYNEDGRLFSGTSIHNDVGMLPTFAGGLQSVAVVYTAGYTGDTGAYITPKDLKLAMIKLARFLLSDKKVSNPKVVRQVLHGEERQFGKLGAAVDLDIIPYDIRSILLQYR